MREMDSRPVPVRTDASANDFWSRVRESSDVSPDFKIKQPTRLSECNKTPFGMQVHPFDVKQSSIMMQVSPAVRSSRSVERIVLQKEVGKDENKEENEEENDMTKANQRDDDQHEEVIRKLRKENAILYANLNRVLRINHALTSNMLSENTRTRAPHQPRVDE